MKRYETSIPRVACGFAAVVMTAITVVVSVVVPAAAFADGAAGPVVADRAPAVAGRTISPGTGLARPVAGSERKG